jgi:hypothetical protein
MIPVEPATRSHAPAGAGWPREQAIDATSERPVLVNAADVAVNTYTPIWSRAPCVQWPRRAGLQLPLGHGDRPGSCAGSGAGQSHPIFIPA